MSRWTITWDDGESITVESRSPLYALESIEHRGLADVARIEREV
ncbi:hypothetical protein [Mycolicibacterium phage Kashi_SSH1]|nr:hypothetical protein [Mycolicibacterium phage Kashi_SSH1]